MMGNRFHVVADGPFSGHSRTLCGVRATKEYLRSVRDSLRAAGEEVTGGASSGYRVNGLHRLYVAPCTGVACEVCRVIPPAALDQAARSHPARHPRWHDWAWLKRVGALRS